MSDTDTTGPAKRKTGAQWVAARPRTLVDHAVDSILSAAARGLILPGDRLSEPDLAQNLNMSRVPIREALRFLESQGVVTSEPYKGIRLMEVSEQRLKHTLDVRVTLETLACTRAMETGRNGPLQMARLAAAIDEMALMAQREDVYGLAQADTQFHRSLIGLAENPVLSASWEALSRQLIVLFGLSTQTRSLDSIVDEHRKLAAVFAQGDHDHLRTELETHIRVQALDVHYEDIIALKRKDRRTV